MSNWQLAFLLIAVLIGASLISTAIREVGQRIGDNLGRVTYNQAVMNQIHYESLDSEQKIAVDEGIVAIDAARNCLDDNCPIHGEVTA